MKTDKEIEGLLMRSKELSLTSEEKQAIKTALLTEAALSLKTPPKSIISPWTMWVVRGSVSFASLLFIFVGTAYAAQDSLPGDALYPLKVHVVEEAISFTKLSPENKIAYDTALLENRFEELQAILKDEAIPSPESLALVAEQIDEHVTHSAAVINETTTEEVPFVNKVEALAKINSYTKAQSKVAATNAELAPIATMLLEADTSAAEALTETIKNFVATEDAADVNSYISEQISEVAETIQGSTTPEVASHLYEVSEALDGGLTETALSSVMEAQETLEVDALIDEN